MCTGVKGIQDSARAVSRWAAAAASCPTVMRPPLAWRQRRLKACAACRAHRRARMVPRAVHHLSALAKPRCAEQLFTAQIVVFAHRPGLLFMVTGPGSSPWSPAWVTLYDHRPGFFFVVTDPGYS